MENELMLNAEDMCDHDSIAAVIYDKAGRLLVMWHHKCNMWTMPIGKVLPDQTIDEALHVELMEECGIKLIRYCPMFEFNREYRRKGTIVKVKMHVFLIHEYEGEIKNAEPEKHSEMHFESIVKLHLKDSISDALKVYLDMFAYQD